MAPDPANPRRHDGRAMHGRGRKPETVESWFTEKDLCALATQVCAKMAKGEDVTVPGFLGRYVAQVAWPMFQRRYEGLEKRGRPGEAGLDAGRLVGAYVASPAYFPEITDPEKRRIAARKLVAKEKGSTYGAVKRADLRFQKTGKTALFWGAPVSNRFPR